MKNSRPANRRPILITFTVFGCMMLASLQKQLHGWDDWASAVIVYLVVALTVTALLKVLLLVFSRLFHRQ
jgi:hypothetical protein